MSTSCMNQSQGSCDLLQTRNLQTKRVLVNGKAWMIQTRSTASQIAVIDPTTARMDDSPAAQRAAVARLPEGYDQTDLRVLEWIAASRRRPSCQRMSEVAA